MMTFEEFKTEVKAKILGYLTSDFQNVKIERIQKNNGVSYDGLIVTMTQGELVPILRLEAYYRYYESGMDFEKVLLAISEKLHEELENGKEIKGRFDEITDFEKVRDRILPKLINATENEALLQNVPHRRIADLAVIYQIRLKRIEENTAFAKITKSLMDMYGVTADELHQLAVENLEKSYEIEFMGLIQKVMGAIYDLNKPEEPEPMNVLSVPNYYCGAAAVLSEKTMESVCDKIGEKFYILPASIGEVIVVPSSLGTVDELKGIVRNVNTESVDAEEKLSDEVYVYDRKNKEIRIAEF